MLGLLYKKKNINPNAVYKNGKKKTSHIVVCKAQVKNGLCRHVISHNDSSTGKMIRHLGRKHNISIKKNTENQEENDPIFLLLMFKITSSLPFRCVENE